RKQRGHCEHLEHIHHRSPSACAENSRSLAAALVGDVSLRIAIGDPHVGGAPAHAHHRPSRLRESSVRLPLKSPSGAGDGPARTTVTTSEQRYNSRIRVHSHVTSVRVARMFGLGASRVIVNTLAHALDYRRISPINAKRIAMRRSQLSRLPIFAAAIGTLAIA